MGDYTVYIDESGDLGINRGTQWFVLSAVVVEKSEEKNIREKINQIKTVQQKYPYTNNKLSYKHILTYRRQNLRAY